MVHLDEVQLDAYHEGHERLHREALNLHLLWVDACAAWSAYQLAHPELGQMPSGERGTIGAMYLVAYAAGRVAEGH